MNNEAFACVRMTNGVRYLERRIDGDYFVDRGARIRVRLENMLSYEGLLSLISYECGCRISR